MVNYGTVLFSLALNVLFIGFYHGYIFSLITFDRDCTQKIYIW